MLITTEQAKEHLKINATLNEENFTPFQPDAEEKYLLPFLSKELYTLLNTWIADGKPATPRFEALMDRVVPVVSRFTLFLAAPFLNVNIGETGFTVTSSSNLVPASGERVKLTLDSLEQLAWGNVERLLEFLEDNQADYPEWVESKAYTQQRRNFINSAVDFSDFYDIDSSRLAFQRLRKVMDHVEARDVVALLSKPFFEELHAKVNGNQTLSPAEVELLVPLKNFIANKVAADALKANTSDIAEFYRKQVKQLLNEKALEFPTYALSDVYNPVDVAPFPTFENSSDKSIFVA